MSLLTAPLCPTTTVVRFRVGWPAEALPLLNIEMPDSLSGQRVDFARGRRLIELANCYRELGKGIQAAQTYDAADAHFRKLGPEPASVVFAKIGRAHV